MGEDKIIHRSWGFDQKEILTAIRELHCPEGFEVDLTYGNGRFYDEDTQPRFKFDLQPQMPGVRKACSTKSPLLNSLVGNVVFDPPFLTYIRAGREHGSIMAKRFSGYWTYEELEQHYRATAKEAHRILYEGGVFVVKCQDIVHNHRLFCTHHNMIRWCEDIGFRLADLYVLGAKHRMPVNRTGAQKHARVYHSYFLVFKKEKWRAG